MKNVQSVSWFLAAGEGRCRRATRQKEKGKNFQITFLVTSQLSVNFGEITIPYLNPGKMEVVYSMASSSIIFLKYAT